MIRASWYVVKASWRNIFVLLLVWYDKAFMRKLIYGAEAELS